MELRKVLVREEPRQIPTERKVCTAKSFMHVPPLPFSFLTVRAFLEKVSPSLVPFIELCGECLACRSSECKRNATQLYTRRELRMTCELLRDRL